MRGTFLETLGLFAAPPQRPMTDVEIERDSWQRT